MVVVEIALSVVLPVSQRDQTAFQQLLSVNPGFPADRVLMVGLPLLPKRYLTYADRIRCRGCGTNSLTSLFRNLGVDGPAHGADAGLEGQADYELLQGLIQ